MSGAFSWCVKAYHFRENDTLPSTDIPRVLTIAGSDSGGGAGIQADLKTCTALGVFGMSAITSITAQNTCGVAAVHDIPVEIVVKQIDMVIEDIGVDAAKTGMLSSAAIVEAVAERIAAHRIEKLVVDPVMVAKSGDALLHQSACESLKTRLVPLAHVITPNIPELEALTGVTASDRRGIEEAAHCLLRLGCRHVLVKGGHLEGPDATDYLFGEGQQVRTFSAPRIDTKNTHGTGCTFSAAIAAYLAKGYDIGDAVERAKHYLTQAIRNSLPLGHGHGPLNHFWKT